MYSCQGSAGCHDDSRDVGHYDDPDDTGFLSDGSYEMDAEELEAMLYGQIHFEQWESEADPQETHTMTPHTTTPHTTTPHITIPHITVETQEVRGEQQNTHQSPFGVMVNFTARSFMSPIPATNTTSTKSLKTKEPVRTSPIPATDTTSTKSLKSKEPVRTSPENVPNQTVVLSELKQAKRLLDDMIVRNNCSQKVNMIEGKGKKTERRNVLVLSDSDAGFDEVPSQDEVIISDDDCVSITSSDTSSQTKTNKVTSKQQAKKSGKQRGTGTSRPVYVHEIDSDSDDEVVMLDDSVLDEDDIDLNVIGGMWGAHRDPVYNKSVNLAAISVATWEGSPALTIGQVHHLLKPGDWLVGDEDLYPEHTQKNPRYYTNSRARCHNCNEKGHKAWECSKPRKVTACALCGETGHLYRRCTNKLCYNCHLPGHSSHSCDWVRKSYRVSCHRCMQQGHVKNDCPELWRQYHLTVETGRLLKTAQTENNKPFCYNCAKKGHFGHECQKEGMNEFWSPLPPFVNSYRTPGATTVPANRIPGGTTVPANRIPGGSTVPANRIPGGSTVSANRIPGGSTVSANRIPGGSTVSANRKRPAANTDIAAKRKAWTLDEALRDMGLPSTPSTAKKLKRNREELNEDQDRPKSKKSKKKWKQIDELEAVGNERTAKKRKRKKPDVDFISLELPANTGRLKTKKPVTAEPKQAPGKKKKKPNQTQHWAREQAQRQAQDWKVSSNWHAMDKNRLSPTPNKIKQRKKNKKTFHDTVTTVSGDGQNHDVYQHKKQAKKKKSGNKGAKVEVNPRSMDNLVVTFSSNPTNQDIQHKNKTKKKKSDNVREVDVIHKNTRNKYKGGIIPKVGQDKSKKSRKTKM